jgi:hypothetical protein
MDTATKNRLADLVQNATAETLQRLACPACGGNLDIQFVPKGRGGKAAGSLSVMCAQCMWRVISDGVPVEPPWVRELGLKVQTVKKLVSPSPDK